MESKRLFLIDGMSHIYRAYYAIRGLSNSKGMPTNAVYGFTSMLRKLIEEQKPDYVGVAFDREHVLAPAHAIPGVLEPCHADLESYNFV